MAGRWSDEEREREYWNRERRYDQFGLDDESDRQRWQGREQRSFEGSGDRVFGERDTGASYNAPRGEGRYEGARYEGGRYEGGGGYQGGGGYSSGRGGGARYGGGSYGGQGYRGERYDVGRQDWQDQDYGGVSPAMRRGDYDTGYRSYPRFGAQDYTRGGRWYGDDGRGPVYRAEYGQGGREYGRVPPGYEAGQRFGTRQADERWEREMHRPMYGGATYSGGTGGYDYERGYGDGGDYGRRDANWHDGRWADRDRNERGYEERARGAGEFVRRTGQKISNWFEGLAREDDRDYAAEQGYGERGARGLGPKGYKRSDERISEDAHQRLTDDPWLDASDIGLSVSAGEVTLSGTVESREAKHRAERVVEEISGVSHVQNNLRIKHGNWFTSAGRGYGDSVQEAQMAQGDTSATTAATATGTTSRANRTS